MNVDIIFLMALATVAYGFCIYLGSRPLFHLIDRLQDFKETSPKEED